jgi:VanZ family protein
MMPPPSTRANALRHAWLILGWCGVVGVIVMSLIPNPPDFVPIEQGDKVEHIVAYGSLMFWFAQVYGALRTRAIVAGLLIALGIAIEYVQGWTGWRDFSYADMAADAAGVALGWLIAAPRTPNLLGFAGSLLARASR